MADRFDHLDDAGDTGRRLSMTNVRLDRWRRVLTSGGHLP